MKFLSDILIKAGLIVEGSFSANAASNTMYAGAGTRLRTETNNLVFERVSSSGVMKVIIDQATLGSTAKAYLGYSNATLNAILSNEHASGGLELRTADVIRQQIFSNGNIVIGQASPVDAGYKLDVTGTAYVSSSLTANAFVKIGGTSSQYLMADGTTSTLTNPITGTGVSGQVAYWSGTNTQTGSNNLFWDATNSRLGIGTNAPASTLDISRLLAGGGLSTILANPTFSITNPANWGYPVGIVFRTPMQDGGAVTNIGSVWCEWQSDNNSYLGFATNTSGTVSEKMRLNASGRLLLGSTTDNGQRLQVTGDTLLRGSGDTSATTALTVQNSASSTMMSISNDAANTTLNISGSTYSIFQANQTTANRFVYFGTASTNIEFGCGTAITNYQFINGGGFGLIRINTTPMPTTGGNLVEIPRAGAPFQPTSGSALFVTLSMQPTINQTGGANGITRGLYVNPTLTAAADWRSIEMSNNSGWGIYQTGASAKNYFAGNTLIGSTTDNGLRFQVTGDSSFTGSGNTSASTALSVRNSDTLQLFNILNNGNVGIPNASSAGYSLNVGKNITGATISAGIWQNGSVLSDVSTLAIGIYNFLRIPASTSISSYQHFRAEQAAFGAGGTLGTQIGFIAENSLIGATNNYGFFGNIASGTGRWNLYMNGTAANYLNGSLGVGTTTMTYKFNVIDSSATYVAGFRGGSNSYIVVGDTSLAGESGINFRNSSGQGFVGLGGTVLGISATSGANTITFSTGGSERARIDASGNLGLGVTPSAWGAGYKAIEYTGGNLASYSTTYMELMQNARWNSGYYYVNNGFASEYMQFQGRHQWFTAPSGTAANPITFVQAMTLDANGRLLVGTTTAGETLTVYNASGGAALFQNSTTGTGASNGLYVGNTAGLGYLWNYNNFAILFGTNSTERMRLFSDGNFGIGTGATNAGFKLDVNGTMRVSGTSTFDGTILTSTVNPFRLRSYVRAENATNGFLVNDSTDSFNNFQVADNGNVRVYRGSLTIGSVVGTGTGALFAGAATFSSSVTANSFVKTGGTSTQYLMADGSTSTLTDPVTGTATAGQVTYWGSSSTITGSNNLFWDAANNRLGIGTNSPTQALTVIGIISASTEFRLNNQSFTRIAIADSGGGFAGGYNLSLSSGITPVHDSTGAISGVHYQSGGTVRFYTNSSQAAGTTATERMRLDASGNLGLGTTSPIYKLDVQGTGNTVGIRAASNTAGDILYYATGTVTGSLNAFTTAINATGGVIGSLQNNNTASGSAFLDINVPAASTGDPYLSFTTSGATNWSLGIDNSDSDKLKLGPVSNPSLAGANTLVAHTTGNISLGSTSDNGLRFQVTGDGYFSGSVVVASAAYAYEGISLRKNLTGLSIAYGVVSAGAIQSDVTSQAYYYESGARTQAASFTLPALYHYSANQSTFGAGSTVTSQYGFFAQSTLIGATNNYGFYGNIASGTNRWNLYMSGTANNYLAGSLGIGATGLSNTNLSINKNLTGLANVYGIFNSGSIRSDVTTGAQMFTSAPSIQNAVFTLAGLKHFEAQGISSVGSATITTQFGFYVESTLTGATTNYGFYSVIAAATGRWNLFMDGTANNFMRGSLLIGSSTTSTGEALQVNGTMRVSGASTFVGNMLISRGSTSPTTLSVEDGTNTTSTESYLKLVAGTTQGYVLSWGQTKSTYKILGAGDVSLYKSGTAGDVAIFNDMSTGGIKMAAGGSSTAHFTIASTGAATFTSSVTAASAIARGQFINTTLLAAANNDALVGLEVQPTFTNGAFTGVENYAIRANGTIYSRGTSVAYLLDNNAAIRVNTNGGMMYIDAGNDLAGTINLRATTLQVNAAINGQSAAFQNLTVSFPNNTISTVTGTGVTSFRIGNTTSSSTWYFENNRAAPSGSLEITNSIGVAGVTLFPSLNMALGNNTDAGFKLDVNGDARISGDLVLSGTVTTATNGDFAGNFTKTYAQASAISNTNLYGMVANAVFDLTNGAYSGSATYNATSLLAQASIAGNAGTQSTQPIRSIMAGLVGKASSAAMNLADFRFIDVKAPDNGGVTGHVIANIYGLRIAALKGASNYTITNGWGVYQEGSTDNNYFNGKVLVGTSTAGSSPVRISGLPTSATGLSAGDLWNDSGTIKIA